MLAHYSPGNKHIKVTTSTIQARVRKMLKPKSIIIIINNGRFSWENISFSI